MPSTPTPPPGDDSRLFVAALARGVSVLAAFDEQHPAMTLPELASACGLTKSAVQRFAHTLWTMGYLRKDPKSKRFSLSPLSLQLGMRYLQTSPFVLGGHAFLHTLNRTSQETCSLAEPDGIDMVYVARFATHKEMFVNMAVGTRLPMYCSAGGRAVMSRLDDRRVKEILRQSPRTAYTGNTITTLDKLTQEVEFARKHGFGRSNGEIYPGDITISAPVVAPGGTPVGSVNVSVPSSRWSFEEAQSVFGPQVIETAQAISASRTIHTTPPYYDQAAGTAV